MTLLRSNIAQFLDAATAYFRADSPVAPIGYWIAPTPQCEPTHSLSRTSISSRIIAFVRAHPGQSAPEIRAGTMLTSDQASPIITQLIQRRLIVRSGPRGKYQYRVAQ